MLIKTLCKYLSFLLSLTFRLLMRSARIVKTNNPLVIEDRPGLKRKNSRVLVRVKDARICHNDLHL
jgi:D-arabinose 1-dehydrogenase-like Zn-dependent alcohol dehydrogenase